MDAAACVVAAKAGIDGIVDCGVLQDDSPQYVKWIRFWAPEKTGVDSFTLVIKEA
jgi:hypothetical protein